MLDSILERPSLEGTQAEGNLNGTARLSVPGCQNGFCTLNGGAEADVGPSSERSLFSLPSVQQSPFTEDASPSQSEPFEPFVRWGSAAAQGQRQAMEDAHVGVMDLQAHTDKALHGQGGAFFGVFDGHGGSTAAIFAEEHLLQALLNQTSFPVKPADALRKAFRLTDEAFYRAVYRAEAPVKDAGSTALAVLVVGSLVLVANAGDSRAVLSRRGKAIDLSRDHKPSCPSERERIAAAGGYVCGEGFLNGQLTVTRALGDFHPELLAVQRARDRLKYCVSDQEPLELTGPLTSDPEIHSHTLIMEDEFMVVACDGLWDMLSSQRCIEIARQHLRDHNDPQSCAQLLVDTCLAKHATDNVTAIVVCFSADPPPLRSYARNSLRGPSRSLSRDGLSTLSSALASATSSQQPLSFP
ncbi:g1345 [Coccomyxa elongata]